MTFGQRVPTVCLLFMRNSLGERKKRSIFYKYSKHKWKIIHSYHKLWRNIRTCWGKELASRNSSQRSISFTRMSAWSIHSTLGQSDMLASSSTTPKLATTSGSVLNGTLKPSKVAQESIKELWMDSNTSIANSTIIVICIRVDRAKAVALLSTIKSLSEE